MVFIVSVDIDTDIAVDGGSALEGGESEGEREKGKSSSDGQLVAVNTY